MRDRLREWYYNGGCEVSQNILNNGDGRKVDYLAIRDGRISYLPKSKMNTDNPWNRAGRQVAKPATAARMVLGKEIADQITDASFESFSYRIAATLPAGEFRVVSGEDIRYWYDYEQTDHRFETGTLSDSCMADKTFALDLYTENPDRISMLCLIHEHRLRGRALLWLTDSGEKVMDRIYGSGKTVQAFINWAEDQGYWHKEYQTYDHNTQFVFDNECDDDKRFQITLKYTDFDYYPYVDTMKYLGSDGLQNFYSGDHRNCLDVVPDDDSREECNGCGDYYDVDDLCDGYCDDCYSRYHCRECGDETYYRELQRNDGSCDNCLNDRTCAECDTVYDEAWQVDECSCCTCDNCDTVYNSVWDADHCTCQDEESDDEGETA
jgi:hypothetical protein